MMAENANSTIRASDAVILFADLQAGIVELTATNSLERLKRAVRALVRLANVMGIPAIVTGVRGQNGERAKVIPEISDGLGEPAILHRTVCDSFQSPEIAAAIQSTGRKTLLISGVATELAVQLAALGGADRGYQVFVVLDACGGISERTEQAALLRITKAGATTVSVMTLAGELAGDFRESKGQQALEIVYEMAGA